MNPIQSPQTDQERHYNSKHAITRSKVERCIGVLKTRFRCMYKERKLRYSPKRANKIILSCVVLQNFLISRNYDIMADIDYQENVPVPENNNARDVNGGDYFRRGRIVRNSLIETLFTHHNE